jgi:hypothetical protein
LLQQELRHTEPDAKRLAQLVSDLDHPQFTVRQQATAELEKLGSAVEEALRQHLEAKPPLEVKRRLQRLLQRLDTEVATRQEYWAVKLLEHVDTLPARELLRRLAKGAPSRQVRQEAREVLKRLEKRGSVR